jgi:alpha-L-arabinofuranosidase
VLTSPIDLFGNNSNKDKQAHGNIEFAAYYLKTLKAYEDQHKTRVLDYLDYHYYPQSDNVFSDSTDPNVLSVRLRCTRSLWDPTYTDESWVKDLGDPTSKIQLIPKLKKMISDNYPGTKLAITEYNWGGLKSLNGALAQADVLGIFGREGLDLAALWGPGNATEPWAYAYRMYRNYDGKGAMFGDTSVSAKSSDSDSVSIFASTRASDKKLIIIVINKNPSTAVNTKITITGHTHSGTARAFTYSQSSLTKIVESTATMSGNDITHNFPAYSITLFEV